MMDLEQLGYFLFMEEQERKNRVQPLDCSEENDSDEGSENVYSFKSQ